ncbi:MAG: putative sulfate exporter family transporter [Proteobacteria bacterium]|nr:MAG: putative sulfate exporter family transporter [Pseudomonadota bacterium]
MKRTIAKIIIPVAAILTLMPFVSSAEALIAGLLIALSLENPYPTKKWIHLLLGVAVAGMGAGMNLETVARVGLQGFGYTVVSIASVIALGLLLKRIFKVEDEVALLITIGTAICGGSAIAAVTPVLRAKSHSVSVALGTVFILNAVALVIFPPIGHFFHMTERAFGIWSALAIHDTSSVVGATVTYGKIAAEVGTTVKLARALWIVPVTLAIGYIKKDANNSEDVKSKKPWFILWFLIAAALVTWIPALQPVGHIVDGVSKRILVLTLFLIGLGLSRETLKTVGFRPLVLGVVLWIITATTTLVLIQNEFIS